MHVLTKSRVWRCVHDEANAVNRLKFNEIVSLPPNMVNIVMKFHAIATSPEVWGVVDGTLTNADAPVDDELAFTDRHGKRSTNCMCVCGQYMIFYYVSAT